MCCQSADGEDEEGSFLDVLHPSVFQLWHDRRPKERARSVSHDCQHLKGLSVQRTCSQRLQHVRNYCSKRQAEEAAVENGASSDGGPDGDVGDSAGRSMSIPDSVVDVFSYRRGKTMVMYCRAYKAASTYWLRLFRFLHTDTNSVASPEAISKFKVHLTPFKESQPLALAYVTRMLRPGDEEFRFLFTRNPYRRLWAVYIDKFVLPDPYFWNFHARAIKDMFRNYDVKQRQKIVDDCEDVSFEDFVRYAVQDPSSPAAHSDDHLRPVSQICNPCTFQPHFIGRVESMTDDSEAVLEKLNLSSLIRKNDFRDKTLDQIRTVTEFVHDTVVARGDLRSCVSDDELQARLIRAFILKAYLPPHVAEVRRTSVAFSVTELLNMMRQLFLAYDISEEAAEAQRKQFFANAYRSLPWDLLQQVRDYYKEDFAAFGYDPEPPELFAERQDKD